MTPLPAVDAALPPFLVALPDGSQIALPGAAGATRDWRHDTDRRRSAHRHDAVSAGRPGGVAPCALDPGNAKRLWATSLALLDCN
jgi:hypothetical protein